MTEAITEQKPEDIQAALQMFQTSLEALKTIGLLPADTPGLNIPTVPTAVGSTVAEPTDVTPVEIEVARKAKRPVAPHLVGEFIRWFCTASEDKLYAVKRGQWECVLGFKSTDADKRAHTLVFHSKLTSQIRHASNVICVRPVGSEVTIFNASRITYGSSSAAQKSPQEIAEAAGAIPIPFQNVVSKEEGAGLDLSKLEVIEWGGAEDLVIPPIAHRRWGSVKFHVINRHFAGAAVVRVEGKYFLFDTDREELECHGFNPFFTELPAAASTIAEAYELLMPDTVKEARAEGRTIVRQGEFFFVGGYDDYVRDHVAGIGEEPRFFFDQVHSQIDKLGAAVINCHQYTQLEQIKAFLKLANDNNNGLLDDATGTNAVTAVADFQARLALTVGPEASHLTKADTEKDESKVSRRFSTGYDGSSQRNTQLPHIYSELASRLDFRDSAVDNSRDSDGPDYQFQIQFDHHIGSDGSGWNRNTHNATAIWQPEDDVAYAMGAIIHTGREHRPVYLDGWYRVYPNTATNNWTVEGDVD